MQTDRHSLARRLCNVRKVSFDPWVVTIGRLGRGVGAGGGDDNVYEGGACLWHMQGGELSAILVTLSSFRKCALWFSLSNAFDRSMAQQFTVLPWTRAALVALINVACC